MTSRPRLAGPALRVTVLALVLAGSALVPAAAVAGVKVVVTNSEDNTVSVIDLASGAASTIGHPSFNHPRSVAVSFDGRFAAVANSGAATVTWLRLLPAVQVLGSTLVTAGTGLDLPNARARSIALTRSEAVITLDSDDAAEDDAIAVVDIRTLPRVPTAAAYGLSLGAGANPDGVAVTRTDRFAAVVLAGRDFVVYVDLALKALIAGGTTVDSGPSSVAITPNGGWALVTNTGSDTVSIIRLVSASRPPAPPTPTFTVATDDAPTGIAIDATGDVAVIAETGVGKTRVLELTGYTSVQVPLDAARLPADPRGVAVAITPRAAQAAITGDTAGQIALLDLNTGTVTDSIPVGAGPVGIAATPAIAPVARLSALPFHGRAGAPSTFNAGTSTDADGRITQYTYSFGDGTPAVTKVCELDPTCTTATHTFAVAASRIVTVTVVDDDGLSKTARLSYAVQPDRLPYARFATVPLSGRAPLTVQFTDRSFDDGSVVARCWNFGQGVAGCNSTEANPRHTFPVPGRYRVTLTVTDEIGQASKPAAVIVIVNP